MPATKTVTNTVTAVATADQSNNIGGKPPRPTGSLDRRRAVQTNRQERDCKSRSAHYLKERSVPNEFKDQSNSNNNNNINSNKGSL